MTFIANNLLEGKRNCSGY